jgi:hypothetical protein
VTDQTPNEVSLLVRVAQESGVSVELLEDLAALEKDVPDLNLWGAKAEFARKVAALLDDEAQSVGFHAELSRLGA